MRRIGGRTSTPPDEPHADPKAAHLAAAREVARRQDANRLASARRLLAWIEIERRAPEGTLAAHATLGAPGANPEF